MLHPGAHARVGADVLGEARDEIASIARHTGSSALRARCERLLTEHAERVERSLTMEPFYDDMPAAVLIGGYFYHWYGRPAYQPQMLQAGGRAEP